MLPSNNPHLEGPGMACPSLPASRMSPEGHKGKGLEEQNLWLAAAPICKAPYSIGGNMET